MSRITLRSEVLRITAIAMMKSPFSLSQIRRHWKAALTTLGVLAVTAAAPLTVASSADRVPAAGSAIQGPTRVSDRLQDRSADRSTLKLSDELALDSGLPMEAARLSSLTAVRLDTQELLKPVAPAKSPAPSLEKPARTLRQIRMEVTAYCACVKCCGSTAQGITASGKRVTYNNGHFVAADTRVLSFRTKLSIPGYNGGQAVEVIDTGSAIKGNKLDVFFASHEEARKWGRQTLTVAVVE